MASFHDGSVPVAVEPYQALASVYDLVMEHVDYVEWAEYVHTLMETFCPGAKDVLELGCGTGSLALELCAISPLAYVATDGSPQMIHAAEAKADDPSIQFRVADLRDFSLEREFDTALFLYDGINYLLTEDEIAHSLECVRRHVRSGGIFIFDQSTPANSLNNRDFFEDSGETEGEAFVRRSHYDEETRLHHTSFDLAIDGAHYSEHHVQRAYSLDEMRRLITRSGWLIVASLDGFTLDGATETSERVHWILRAG